MSKARLESFSDGVMAVAITLLVLNITVPTPGHASLAHQLGQMWPQYAAYAVSFLTIGIIWVNHHAAFGRVREVDHTLLLINLAVLMSIVLLPFATALMADYLRLAHGQHLAAAVYGAALLFMSFTFALLNFYTLAWRPHLLTDSVSAEHRRRLLVRGVGGAAPYVLATALAPVSAVATLVITGAVAAFYASPLASRPD